MRHIVVMNAKGGCGKSTLATNIASYFANEGASVALADYDPQRSSLDWLERRPADKPQIAGVAAFDGGLRHAPRNVDFIVIDDLFEVGLAVSLREGPFDFWFWKPDRLGLGIKFSPDGNFSALTFTSRSWFTK